MERTLNTVCSLPPVGTNKRVAEPEITYVVSCTMVVSITLQAEVLLLLG